MAKSFYQIPTIPRLYVSYPLWQYANGGLSVMHNGANSTLTEDKMIKLINLEPSNPVNIVDENNNGAIVFGYNVIDSKKFLWNDNFGSSITSSLPEKLWNFNYGMVLNHNLATRNSYINFRQITGADSEEALWYGSPTNLSSENIINWLPENGVVSNDGFSVFKLSGSENTYRIGMGIFTGNPTGNTDEPFYFGDNIEIGSILWGKYYDFPQHCDINISLSYLYDNNSSENIFGEKISTGKWNKVDGWHSMSSGTEPFGLRKPYVDSLSDNYSNLEHDLHDTSSSHRRKSGARVWNVSFDALSPQNVMSQNPMMNNNEWNRENWDSSSYFSNYELDAFSDSEYNIDEGSDFYTNVVHKTNGGTLPMVMQLDKDDPSPQNFAIVKMSNYVITQKLPNLYNISLVLEEQV